MHKKMEKKRKKTTIFEYKQYWMGYWHCDYVRECLYSQEIHVGEWGHYICTVFVNNSAKKIYSIRRFIFTRGHMSEWAPTHTYIHAGRKKERE